MEGNAEAWLGDSAGPRLLSVEAKPAVTSGPFCMQSLCSVHKLLLTRKRLPGPSPVVLNQESFFPQGTFGRSRDIFGCHSWRGEH